MSKLPEPGGRAPAFSLPNSTGGRYTSSNHPTGSPVRLLFFFKYDCSTCRITAPLVERVYQTLSSVGLKTLAVSQSDPSDTNTFKVEHALSMPVLVDTDFQVSAQYGFDRVPAFVLTTPTGLVLKSFEGWNKKDFSELLKLAASHCDATLPPIDREDECLPDNQPGCGSRVHEPNIARALVVRREKARLRARRIQVPVDADPFEFLSDQGLTDGLPVIPPTEERVLRMLDGTSRAPDEIVAVVPPNLTPVTVEKIAINAVMAGCRPDYLPVVLAAVEAACSDRFNLHGVLATTYFATPVLVINGPIRREIGINCGRNAFGQGSRANAAIGRALQLVVLNIGGGRPGQVDMSTLGQPGKFTCCIGENEEASCWEPLHVERGFAPDQSTVTVFAGEAPRAVRDQVSRSAQSLATSMGLSLESVAHVKLRPVGEVMLIVSPEHVRTFAKDHFSKNALRKRIQETAARPLHQVLPDVNCEKGVSLSSVPPNWLNVDGQPTEEALSRLVPKFAHSNDILIVVAGGTAGMFSAILGGWLAGSTGSIAVTKEITG